MSENSTTARVRIEKVGTIAHVILSRPEKHNGMDMVMLKAVITAAKKLAGDKEIRAVILRGDGPSFCAGLDFKTVMGQPAKAALAYTQLWWPMRNDFQSWSMAWREVGVPVIAAIHGNCFGAGIQLAMGADIRVTTPDAKISIMAPGLTFGALVFEGYRAYWNKEKEDLFIFRLEEHMQRLKFSMNLLELDDPPSVETFTNDILATLKANEFREDTYIRLQVYVDDWGSMLATGPVGSSVICRPRPRVADFSAGKEFVVSSWRRNAENASPPRIKAAANYLNSRMAGLEAKRQGAGGAVLLNDDGTVSEGPGGCLFIMRDGVFITPNVTSGILESVTRRAILEFASEAKVKTAERKVGRTELYLAEEAFYCGTGQEIMPIIMFDGRPVGNGLPGPVTQKLQTAFDNIVRGRDTNFDHWLTPVYNA